MISNFDFKLQRLVVGGPAQNVARTTGPSIPANAVRHADTPPSSPLCLTPRHKSAKAAVEASVDAIVTAVTSTARSSPCVDDPAVLRTTFRSFRRSNCVVTTGLVHPVTSAWAAFVLGFLNCYTTNATDSLPFSPVTISVLAIFFHVTRYSNTFSFYFHFD